MTRTRPTTWLLRGADAIALVALVASLVVVGQRLSSGGSPQPSTRAAATPVSGKPGDRDGDGVPDAQDLAPDSPAPQKTPAPLDSPSVKLPPLDDCRRKGITRKLGKEGSCYEESGRRVLVVDRGARLHLPELDGRVMDLRVHEHPAQRTADVSFDIEVRNNLDGLVDVQPSHFGLLLGRGVYAPNLLATGRDANSMFKRGIGLRAREHVSGTVTFTVSRRAARHLDRDGNLELLQFSDTSLDKASLTVGVFRTYR
jgi:hypothetical protein